MRARHARGVLACAILLAPSARCALDVTDETNVRIPRKPGGQPLSTEERLRVLELKVGSYMNWAKDPFFGFTRARDEPCVNSTVLCRPAEAGRQKPWDAVLPECSPGLYDHPICLDNKILPPLRAKDAPKVPDAKPCVVYDFGVRAQPQFGMVLAEHMGCEVHAFDPSPVSVEWYKEEQKNNRIPPNYHFHRYGAGGNDGTVQLSEYNWGQVSILRMPSRMKNCSNVPRDDRVFTGLCQTRIVPRKSFELKVHTLSSIMSKLGHAHIDVLKVDVEGSEYAFLENAIDTGAIGAVEQLALEWHHFAFDQRYGVGSAPNVNALVTMLSAMGLHCWFVHSEDGWDAPDSIFTFVHMHNVNYNLASFKRRRAEKPSAVPGRAQRRMPQD